jgi:hypothetical protein
VLLSHVVGDKGLSDTVWSNHHKVKLLVILHSWWQFNFKVVLGNLMKLAVKFALSGGVLVPEITDLLLRVFGLWRHVW